MAEVTNKTQVATGAAAKTAPAVSTPSTRKAPGLQFRRYFTKPGTSPYDQFQWELRTASITDAQGKTIFEQKNVETPKDWSMTATNIVASKYLHGTVGTPERESGVRALVGRVAETISDWGVNGGYFATRADADTFHDELAYILLDQRAAFNSPVWFNVGCDRLEPNSDAQNWHWNPEMGSVQFGVTGYRNPQCSACFINSVKDSLDSILTLAKTEGMLFKWGSGTGTNLSPLRSSTEQLSGGGTASGPLSFMRGFDAFAGVIKSGGKTRRAAKMVILNVDHPDIEDFIDCKREEEAKAWALIREGYDGSTPDSPAYSSIFFQNANNSVRVTDEFMNAAINDENFFTRSVKEKKPFASKKAKDLLRKIAEATYYCGDPGMQYDTTINKWHTSKNTARINASNPCSEYMFLDDSACNLASINLLKFYTNNTFDIEAYKFACDVLITAQEILVDSSGYPTEAIARNSHDYRPLGLGYANLGGLLMAAGLPYDSDAGRDYAACLTAIMCGEAYYQSSKIAELCLALAPATPLTQTAEITGAACPGFYVNREPFLDVIRMHRASVNNIGSSVSSVVNDKQLPKLIEASKEAWDNALAHGEKHGYRNSQVTVLAPTGTIGFMMDCDTTGIEPDLALVKYKKLVGGGMIKIVNNTVPTALFKLGYSSEQANNIVSYIDATGTIEGAPGLKEEHLPVFDCSFKPSKGTRSIHYIGHIKMMAATQPFISGAISKTVNLPNDATVEEIAEAYIESWRQGLKAVAIYRDGSKGAQPLNVSDGNKAKDTKASTQQPVTSQQIVPEVQDQNAPPKAVRHRLPEERASLTHKFSIAGHEGYITVGLYPNGQPGEIFIKMAKEGSTVSGLMDAFATSISLALQHGVPLKVLCEKFAHTRFEPSGWSGNGKIGFAKSITDYIFRWLHFRFVEPEQGDLFEGMLKRNGVADPAASAGSLPAPPESVAGTTSSGAQSGLAGSRKLEAGSVHPADALRDIVDMGDAPSCHVCGSIMTRNGSCYRCMSCGSTSGCS
ncbi:MAG TPA: vitamin B12-dependent ribonucleotide reductase [Terriglobales bacterium]|jgi:ribonucleoside-diphosphate reductase alpha chain|nr:vitamin B12-dependent ribonucleotide reductase [Terriglobales bacterium]